MIFFTGDPHGELERFYRFETEDGKRPGKGDYLIVCGDCGIVFHTVGTMGYIEERRKIAEIEKLPFTVLFVDGNHENFHRLYQYPKKRWQGGWVHEIAPNILHLMRGEIYTLEGKTIFAMGGGYSRDKHMRIEGLSWWPEELPNEKEYKNAERSLKDAGMKVDIIVSHQAPREIIRRMGRYPDAHDNELTGFLEWIMYEVDFKAWFFGHWHDDKEVAPKFRLLWFDTVTCGDGVCPSGK